MTKKQRLRTHGFGRRTLSVLLSLLMVLSTFAVMMTAMSVTADAAISYWYVSGNFNGWTHDHSSANSIPSGGGSVTIPLSGHYASSIEFKMVAYENGEVWCGLNGTGSYVDMNVNTETKLKWTQDSNNKNIRVLFPENTVSATFVLSVKGQDNYITVTPNTSGGGEGGDTGAMTYSAPVNASNSANTDKSKIFWAAATYFDYLSDEELSNTKWLKPIQAGTGFNDSKDDWYPFYRFNREVVKAKADADSAWTLPLYFGNFCNTYNAYDTSHHPGVSNGFNDATNDYNVTRFVYAPNNSSKDNADSARTGVGLSRSDESYQGLMNSTLSSSGDLLLPDGTVAPYFDSSESGALSGRAKVINSSFPFTVSSKNGYTFYEFDSTDAKDNVYFTWGSGGGETYPTYVNYGSGTDYGILDGGSRFMYQGTSGYGIFPFNNANTANANLYKGNKANANENLNYGFGIRIDVNFRVPKPDSGSNINSASNPIKFDFSGDDDLWMYITNNRSKQSQLILDMGGSHAKSTGSVNFNTCKATVNHVFNGRTDVTTDKFDYNYNDTYTMTVFYMERGLIESNMKMSFTMTPLGNNFIVTEEVDTAYVNEGIRDIVKGLDSFGFNPYKNGSQISGSYRDFKLADGGIMSIPDTALDINSEVKVSQYAPSDSYLVYDTSWKYYDNQGVSGQTLLDSGETPESSVQTLINPTGNEFDFAELQIDYKNTPRTTSVSITKEVDDPGVDHSDEVFPATVYLQFKPGETPAAYDLYTSDGWAYGGRVNLQDGKTITVSGVPVGTHVTVVEDRNSDFKPSYSADIVAGTIDSLTVTNTPIAPVAAEMNINKYISYTYTDSDGYEVEVNTPYVNGDLFSFKAEGLGSVEYSSEGGVSRMSQNASFMSKTVSDVDENGTVVFESGSDNFLSFTRTGVYIFKLTELSVLSVGDNWDDNVDMRVTYNADIGNDDSTYLAKFVVEPDPADPDQLIVTERNYYRYDGTSAVNASTFSDSNKLDANPEFKNPVKKGSVKVNKTDGNNGSLSDVEFTVYKVSGDNDEAGIVSANFVASATTGADGVAEFTGLDLYQTNEYGEYEGLPEYQWYALQETKTKDGHVQTKTIQYFTLPMVDSRTGELKYDITFDYVNGAIKNPYTAGWGTDALKYAGLGIIAFAALMLAAYVFFFRKKLYVPVHLRK